MARLRLNNCNNISDFSKYAVGLDLSHDKLHLKIKIESSSHGIIVNGTALPNKYYDIILNSCTRTIQLSAEEYMQYRYQPKLYCYHRYGTTELWSLLLKINNMVSVAEFTQRTIKIFNDDIFGILNEIMILEQDNIVSNIVSIE